MESSGKSWRSVVNFDVKLDKYNHNQKYDSVMEDSLMEISGKR